MLGAGMAASATAIPATATILETASHIPNGGVRGCATQGGWHVNDESAWAGGHAGHPKSHDCCLVTGTIAAVLASACILSSAPQSHWLTASNCGTAKPSKCMHMIYIASHLQVLSISRPVLEGSI